MVYFRQAKKIHVHLMDKIIYIVLPCDLGLSY